MNAQTKPDLTLELITEPSPNRPNRLCVSVSDLHFTDGTVGYQNLGPYAWEAFYKAILQRCIDYYINELVLVLDGDVVDMIRSSKWAENDIYPWQRDRKEAFSKVVNAIIRDIIDDKHKDFFAWLRNLETALKRDTREANPDTVFEKVKIVVTVGNHDKELLCDNEALTYFYEKGLGIALSAISEERRRVIGRMYGDETLFLKTETAPYLPFYYGDKGFRFFTTHGQWRDKDNCAAVNPQGTLPGWSVNDGWNIKTWQALQFSPFLLPCFGDSVAAGVLSTFIYETKKQLDAANYRDQRLDAVLDELDLYRPTYLAVARIIKLAAQMRREQQSEEAVQIIEETLYRCIMRWLDWDFTFASSSKLRCVGLTAAKWLLKLLNSLGHGLKIKAIAWLMKLLAVFDHAVEKLSFNDMVKFPSFMPEYRHYGFQIHGEGHTHQPWQEELNVDNEKHLSTYINFGTWRSQIVPRKKDGYRRRGMSRALFILDLENKAPDAATSRSLDYFVTDIIHWGDRSDAMDATGHSEPRT